MEKPKTKMKARFMSVLRPDQRRNWSKDHVRHYEYFLSDFDKIKGACNAKISGIEVHALLEKEIRNSYWIYRSSPMEQAVLIAKICTRRVMEEWRRKPRAGGQNDWNPRGKVKAVFAASPATGLESLCKVASSCFEKDEVIFACSEDNSRVQKEIGKRGFDVLLLGSATSGRWRAAGEEARFLKEFWRGLRSIKRLNFFQKVFVYLYTRSALRGLLTYEEAFLSHFQRDVRYMFTGRPRTPFVNGAIMAARGSSVSPIFVSHTIWYKLPCPVGQLYDLSVFSGAVLQTDRCRQEVQRASPAVSVEVVGMAKPSRSGEGADSSTGRRMRVGFFLGVNDFVSDLLPKLAGLDVEVLLKTRPPGNNADQFSFVTDQFDNVQICDHAEYSMEKFCETVDVVVGGYSNAVFQAACLGVPVIGYLTPEERRYNAFLTPVLIPFDISVIQAKDADELVSEVGRIAARQGDLAELSQKQLLAANASISDVNYRSVRNLLDR